MGEEPQATVPDSSTAAGWQQALDELERSLRQAVHAISALRSSLSEGAPPPAPAERARIEMLPADASPEQRARSTFERLWERIELERRERAAQDSGEQAQSRKGLELLPQEYLMTVEDREGKVDLIPLHRALLAFVPVENISLLSFANGVPVISLRSQGELNLDRLGAAVSAGMDRQCEVIPQDNGRVYLRLQARPGQEA